MIENPAYLAMLKPLLDIVERENVSEVAINNPSRDPSKPTAVYIQHRGEKSWVEEFVPGLDFRTLNIIVRAAATAENLKYHPERLPIAYCSLTRHAHRMTAVGGQHIRFGSEDADGLAIVIRQGRAAGAVDINSFAMKEKVEGISLPDFKVSNEKVRAALETIASGKGVFIIGQKNSGKTTLLAEIANRLSERTAVFQDQNELKLTNPNRVGFYFSRTESTTGLSIGDLIKAVRRMTCDVIIMGEMAPSLGRYCRELLNFGTAAFLATKHAPNCADAYRDLFNELRTENEETELVKDHIHSRIGMFIHLAQDRDGSRVITEIKTPAEIEQEIAA